MKGAIDTKISPFGVPLLIHFTAGIWLLLLTGPFGLPAAMAMTLIIMLSVTAHEYGHVWAAQKLGVGTRMVVLHGFGGAAVSDEPFIFHHPKTEVKVALAGPAVSLILAGVGFLGAKLVGGSEILLLLFSYLFFTNLMLAVFNLLPIFPMDGGRVLRGALTSKLGAAKAVSAAAVTTYVFGGILGLLGIVFGYYFLAFIMGAVIYMAYKERKQTLSLLLDGSFYEPTWYE